MRISDWSSDVCSSDLSPFSAGGRPETIGKAGLPLRSNLFEVLVEDRHTLCAPQRQVAPEPGRSAVWSSCAYPMSRTFPRQIKCLRSEEHTSELQSLMRISYAVFCLKKKTKKNDKIPKHNHNKTI